MLEEPSRGSISTIRVHSLQRRRFRPLLPMRDARYNIARFLVQAAFSFSFANRSSFAETARTFSAPLAPVISTVTGLVDIAVIYPWRPRWLQQSSELTGSLRNFVLLFDNKLPNVFINFPAIDWQSDRKCNLNKHFR